MARKSFVFLVMGTVIFFLCSVSSADVPDSINYQGKLTTAQGGCLNDTVSMTFTIYSDDQGTVVDWTEDQDSVIVKEGIFNVLLGNVTPLPASVFDGSVKYLGVRVGLDQEMRPLKPMVSVPYAYRAGTVDGGAGGGWVDDGTVVRLETSTDYVGIGTTNPQGPLQVGGGTFIVTVDNDVGIGTTTPAEKLDVSGNIKASGTITSGNTITIDGVNDKITASSGTIDFDNENLVTTGKATIGPNHTNTGTDAFVAGYGNTASGSRSTVSGGYQNTASGTYYSTVGGGQNNTASGSRSTVSGGRDNAASEQYCTVGGGYSDTASSYAATVGGGEGNTASGNYSTVGGGNGNTASGWKSVVGGGGNNVASNWLSVIGGGYGNEASGHKSIIGGGVGNTASGDSSTVGGGQWNTASGISSTVGGGTENTASGLATTVGGGTENTASDDYSTVSGGYDNIARYAGAVGGGVENTAILGWYNTVAGGRADTARGSGCTVGGGWFNTASDDFSTVGGGYNNLASDDYSTVSGGYNNTASWSGAVGGGIDNRASAAYSTVGGGAQDTASGYSSTIGGGENNTASGEYSTVGGGYNNSNAGDCSVIPGGRNDTLTSNADHSMAFGKGVYVNTQFRVIFFDADTSGRLGLNRDDHDGGISYPIHVGTNANNGNGAYLSADGLWTNASSKAFKTDFQPLDGEEILTQITSLPLEAWKYKGTQGRHIGPYAEDFAQVFGVGTVREDGSRDNKYLAAGDVAGVALAGVKELAQQNQELRQIIEELRQRIADLEKAK